MGPVEITVIVIAILIVAINVGIFIKRKINKEPTGECACCKPGAKKLIKKYKKMYKN